jgi:hypothetical protein
MKTIKTTKKIKEKVVTDAKIVSTPEVVKDEKIEVKVEKDFRECTCGALVKLPNAGEGPTICVCGIKHIR